MSNFNNNRINVPQAKEAMKQFKIQAASQVGVNMTNSYNGHLTSREAGSVGGQIVKKIYPGRTAKYQRQSGTAMGHAQVVKYLFRIVM